MIIINTNMYSMQPTSQTGVGGDQETLDRGWEKGEQVGLEGPALEQGQLPSLPETVSVLIPEHPHKPKSPSTGHEAISGSTPKKTKPSSSKVLIIIFKWIRS